MDPTTQTWRYAVLRGLPFGLGVAVNQFARMANFWSSVQRRLMLLIKGNYADDSPTIDMQGTAQDCSGASCAGSAHAASAGVKYSSSKYQAPCPYATFLGHIHDLCRAAWSGFVVWGPKLGARERLTELCAQAIAQRSLTPGAAAKMRGLASWIDSSLCGRCLRGAMSALIARQYWEPCEEVADGSNLHEALLYIIAAAVNARQERSPYTA